MQQAQGRGARGTGEVELGELTLGVGFNHEFIYNLTIYNLLFIYNWIIGQFIFNVVIVFVIVIVEKLCFSFYKITKKQPYKQV